MAAALHAERPVAVGSTAGRAGLVGREAATTAATGYPARMAAAGAGNRRTVHLRETVAAVFAPTSLGLLLVAASVAGVVAVLLGDTERQLRADFARRFPRLRLRKGDDVAQQAMADVVRFVDRGGVLPLVPLDLRGTPFQLRVWDALRRIPRGRTTTYGLLADKLGDPDAVRAVAGACARNPVAVLVPCHRVIAKTGRLHGYRWGLDRKHALLAREGVMLL